MLGELFHKLSKKVRRRRSLDVAPDETFLDAFNLPQFDTAQFEGRLERPIGKIIVVGVGLVLLVIALAFVGRLWFLQIAHGENFAIESENNRLHHSLIIAPRGVIYDRRDERLVWNTVGTSADELPRRAYTEMAGLAHALGYVSYPSKDKNGFYFQEEYIGRDGVERVFQRQLGGVNGLKIVETDARGEIKSESVLSRPEIGGDVHLSIDAKLQKKLFELIRNRAEESGFAGGSGVIMDVETGEVLTLTNYPEYHSLSLSEGGTESVQAFIADERKPFLNRAVAGLYTPGSILKPIVAVGALEENIINPEKEIVSTGALIVPNPYFPDQPSIFRDWKAHGPVDMRRALAVSSDQYFYVVGGGFEGQQGLGINKIEEYMRRFGLGEATGINWPGEGVGTIPSPAWKEAVFDGEPWRLGNTYHTAIGQYGFQVTPLQVARAVAAIGNDGFLVTPTLLKGETGARSSVGVSDDSLTVVREGMRMAVTEGTAQGLFVPHVAVAAKTGTAELGVQKDFVNSWVIGFFPYEKPRYAFVVMLERGPVTNLIGGVSVMRELLDFMVAETPEYMQ